MSWFSDLFGGDGSSSDPYQNPEEVARIRRQGQQVPSGVEIVGPHDEVTPAEQKVYFPSGLPSEQHRGGLADLAAQSQQAQQAVGPQNAAKPEGPSARTSEAANYRPSKAMMMTDDPTGRAETQHKRGEVVGYAGIANFVSDVVKMLAGGYAAGAAGAAGGAAGGAGGAAGGAGAAGAAGGAGAAGAGAAGGASAAGGEAAGAGGAAGGGSSFGSNFMQGFQGQGGEGYGGQMGTMARKYAQNYMQQGGSSGGGGGGGGGGGDYMSGMKGGDPGSRIAAGTRYMQGRRAEALAYLAGEPLTPTAGGYFSTAG